ncbi:phosphatase PAP2 family protein [Rufibacter psychrotolerans]|uniref:phosphatase PAP2 family protein n=1 Tax=Rufibacter psychrotolerans TaxID=2812556 RepID=UPI001967BD1B|nr:phosphatase PAP2 family protein [Rufibacter sp. SYSU D00308]
MQLKEEQTNQKAKTALSVVTLQMVIAWVVFVGSALLFFWMATVVFVEQEKDLDQAAFELAEEMTTPQTTQAMYFVTFFGSKNFLIFGSLGLAVVFLLFKKWRFYSLKVIAISATTTLFNQSMKFLFGRPRPETAFLEQGGNSFPSGHAMIGGAFWGLLMYLLWTNVERTWLRWLLSLLLGGWIFLIGFSRVYLNVHYASDVLAGWGAGIFWLMLSIYLLNRLQQHLGKKVDRQLES